ncbi:hypothetical protein GYMLUDRAFT_109043, partial [Collybiopsis luxurians FD-317 M1]
ISLPTSKTDPFHCSVTVVLAAVPHLSTCPVSALKNLFPVHPLPVKALLFVDAVGSPLCCSAFISILKQCIASVGLDITHFAGHSFYCSTASSAATVGYSDYEIQLLRQWCSN